MKIQFCGAAKNVTGSSHVIKLDSGTTIMLDCGLFQGEGKETYPRNANFYVNPNEIDYLVLSHAHIDHCGRVPLLYKKGFRGKILCTHATRSLAAIMLLDSAFIQEQEVAQWNKRQLKKDPRFNAPRDPLYTVEDAQDVIDSFISIGYESWFQLHSDVKVLFRDAGHILGSASVTLDINEGGERKLIGFTGDIGRPNRPILQDPIPMPAIDVLICESTYGDKEHEDGPTQTNTFLNVIQEACVNKKGKLIIPAFSVGRTQEIVFMLDQLESAGKLPKIKVYVDSPLAVDATDVFRAHPECFDKELHKYLLKDGNPFGFRNLRFISDVNESKALNDSNEPCIIISSSGMGNAGRVKHHLYNNIGNPRHTVLIVGYCSPETPGGKLRAGLPTLRLFGEEIVVKADVKIMDSFSAHGDRKEMLDFIANQKDSVKKLFLVHGEEDTQTQFKTYLGQNGFKNIFIPNEGESFTV